MKVNQRQAGIGKPCDPNYFMHEITVDKAGVIRPIAHSIDGACTALIIDNSHLLSLTKPGKMIIMYLKISIQ